MTDDMKAPPLSEGDPRGPSRHHPKGNDMTHAVIRTSPKGQPFKGRCTKCGHSGLGPDGALAPCPKDAEVPDNEALLDILGRDEEDGA